MIKDIAKIKEHLVGFVEVGSDHEFVRGDHVSYIKLKGNEESFYPGGGFQGKGDNCLFLVKKGSRWKVPLSERHPDGSEKYRCRFFVKAVDQSLASEDVRELNQMVQYQQGIIEKLGETLKQLEFQKHELTGQLLECQDLLSQTRGNLGKAIRRIKEKEQLVAKYQDLIQKLSQSHPMMVGVG
mgnify:CR=1 FL=1